MAKLSDMQFVLLKRLAAGEHLCFSQDGDRGWFWPSRLDLDDLGISDRELQQLRDRGLLANEPEDENQHDRFGPPQIITPAGHRALEEEKAP